VLDKEFPVLDKERQYIFNYNSKTVFKNWKIIDKYNIEFPKPKKMEDNQENINYKTLENCFTTLLIISTA